jgi:ferritin-like metal-binding protein YciE
VIGVYLRAARRMIEGGSILEQETLQELFIEQIRDLYDAEKQIVKALPKVAKAAGSQELASALQQHLAQTQTHVSRLERIFELQGTAAKGKACKGMKGLLEEGSEATKEGEQGPLRDVAIIAACQKVEHYEISAYGTARTLADRLVLREAIQLLQQTENEEEQADEKLTTIATSLYAGLSGSAAAPKTRNAGG